MQIYQICVLIHVHKRKLSVPILMTFIIHLVVLAHDKKVKERIGDYRLIRKTLSLPLNYQDSVNQEGSVCLLIHLT